MKLIQLLVLNFHTHLNTSCTGLLTFLGHLPSVKVEYVDIRFYLLSSVKVFRDLFLGGQLATGKLGGGSRPPRR